MAVKSTSPFPTKLLEGAEAVKFGAQVACYARAPNPTPSTLIFLGWAEQVNHLVTSTPRRKTDRGTAESSPVPFPAGILKSCTE